MTPDPEFTWIIDWTLVTVIGNAMPPRDPNDNDDEVKKLTSLPLLRATTANVLNKVALSVQINIVIYGAPTRAAGPASG